MLTQLLFVISCHGTADTVLIAILPCVLLLLQEWRPRQKGPAPIGRMYMAHPSDVERFHIRLLLCHVRGAKCHDDLRTVEGVRYPTFKEAAARLGLLEDDAEWDAAMEEAASMQSPASLRQLFAALLLCCSPANPQALWNKHQASLTEDLLHRRRQVMRTPVCPLQCA